MLIVLDNNENWSQTETHILLKFSNISHHTHASDFNGCDNYIKINLNPYIYECFFDQPIKFDSIVTHIERDFISCTFEKIDNVIWTNFSKTFESKTQQNEFRQKYLLIVEDMYKEKLCKEEAGREAQKKALVNRQIDLQNVKRNAISEKKDKQFNNHSEEINNLTCRLNDNETKNPKMNKSNSFDECKDNYENEKCFDASDEADSSNEEEKTYLCSENSKCYNKPKKHKNYKIRNRNINFQFSARAFPCASRESTLDSENKWLTKQKEMLCLSKSEESQFSQNENNPDWLEDKAKDLFTRKLYHGSINAYNALIYLRPKDYKAYSNRSTCHFVVKNYMKCIDDISNAIDLIEPRCDSNRLMRVKLYAKRGACFLYFDMVKEACSDYKTAALLDPSNKGLIKDFVYLETLIKKNRK